MIDHFGGGDRRHPRRGFGRHGRSARGAPARNVRPRPRADGEDAAQTPARCENQRSEASSRLPCPGCSFLQVCLPTCVLCKKLAGEQGTQCEDTEIGSGSLSIACPVQGVRFYKCTCHMRFSAQKNPPAGKPGDFYQAFAVRWVFSRAITTGGISTS